VTKSGIWKAPMPSIKAARKVQDMEKKTYFGYSGRHQVHMNFQTRPASPFPTCCTPAKVSTAVKAKIMHKIEFIFALIILLTNLLLRKDNYQK
jgi:hypothetical protein